MRNSVSGTTKYRRRRALITILVTASLIIAAFGIFAYKQKIQAEIAKQAAEKARSTAEMFIPFGRSATPEEVARGVYFLCSPLSDYVHGQVLNVSGGLQMGMGT